MVKAITPRRTCSRNHALLIDLVLKEFAVDLRMLVLVAPRKTALQSHGSTLTLEAALRTVAEVGVL